MYRPGWLIHFIIVGYELLQSQVRFTFLESEPPILAGLGYRVCTRPRKKAICAILNEIECPEFFA